MTREEAIQVLENELKANCKTCMHPQEVGYCEHTCTYREAMDTAISIIEDYEAKENAVAYWQKECSKAEIELYELEEKIKQNEPKITKVRKDGTLFVTVLDAEKVKKVFVNDLQGFCNTFCEEPKQNDDSDYDSLVPDEYKTESSDLISRRWLLDLYGDYIGDNGKPKYHVPLEVVRQNIIDAPSADAVQGEWEQEYRKTANGVDFCVIACSERDYYDAQMHYYNYCPSCGARMKGGAE